MQMINLNDTVKDVLKGVEKKLQVSKSGLQGDLCQLRNSQDGLFHLISMQSQSEKQLETLQAKEAALQEQLQSLQLHLQEQEESYQMSKQAKDLALNEEMQADRELKTTRLLEDEAKKIYEKIHADCEHAHGEYYDTNSDYETLNLKLSQDKQYLVEYDETIGDRNRQITQAQSTAKKIQARLAALLQLQKKHQSVKYEETSPIEEQVQSVHASLIEIDSKIQKLQIEILELKERKVSTNKELATEQSELVQLDSQRRAQAQKFNAVQIQLKPAQEKYQASRATKRSALKDHAAIKQKIHQLTVEIDAHELQEKKLDSLSGDIVFAAQEIQESEKDLAIHTTANEECQEECNAVALQIESKKTELASIEAWLRQPRIEVEKLATYQSEFSSGLANYRVIFNQITTMCNTDTAPAFSDYTKSLSHGRIAGALRWVAEHVFGFVSHSNKLQIAIDLSAIGVQFETTIKELQEGHSDYAHKELNAVNAFAKKLKSLKARNSQVDSKTSFFSRLFVPIGSDYLITCLEKLSAGAMMYAEKLQTLIQIQSCETQESTIQSASPVTPQADVDRSLQLIPVSESDGISLTSAPSVTG